MGDKSRGWFNKFQVVRADGADQKGGKHHGCEYFVLDLNHDPHALPALLAYADSAEKDGYQTLAYDIRDRVSLRASPPQPSQSAWGADPARTARGQAHPELSAAGHCVSLL